MSARESEFGRVYDEHVWSVYGFLAYRVGHRETAEDLTQATFERALRAWSRFDPRRGSERTWLLAIARNLLVDRHRRRDPREAAGEAPAASTVAGPEDRFAGSAELEEALRKLPEREREILALRYGGDLSGAEIAALLGLSVANVQQIISRALRKLRELLGGSYSTPALTSAPTVISNKPRIT